MKMKYVMLTQLSEGDALPLVVPVEAATGKWVRGEDYDDVVREAFALLSAEPNYKDTTAYRQRVDAFIDSQVDLVARL
jgi:hypothetical protein